MSNRKVQWNCKRFRNFLNARHREETLHAAAHFRACPRCQGLYSIIRLRSVKAWEARNPCARGSLNKALYQHRKQCRLCIVFAKNRPAAIIRDFYLKIAEKAIERVAFDPDTNKLLFTDTKLLHIDWCITEVHWRIKQHLT